jgi:hypothetical protein
MNKRNFFDIDKYIRVEETQDQSEKIVFRHIELHINQQTLKDIIIAKNNRDRLRISPELKTKLRRSVISQGALPNQQAHFLSGLTFYTYYEFAGTEKIMMRSVISSDGDITQQIRRDCLDFPERGLAIATAHHWILEQLIWQLRLKININLDWIPLALATMITFLFVIIGLLIYHSSINPLTLLALPLMWWLFYQGLELLLKMSLARVKQWIAYQTLLLLLSINPNHQQIEKTFFGKFLE